MSTKKEQKTETCKNFASYRPTNDTSRQIKEEYLEMSIKRIADDAAKNLCSSKNYSDRVESSKKMENILEERRNTLEDSNLNFIGSLIEKITKSDLSKRDKELLVKFIENQHFDYETIYELCYLHLDIYAQPYVDYLKLQIEEGTKFNVKLLDYTVEKLKYTSIWSNKINVFFNKFRNELNQSTEVTLNYYKLEKCPVCNRIGNIYANVRNYGAHIGVAYFCNCHEGDK